MPDTPRNYIRLAGSERRPDPTARLLGPAEDTETLTATRTPEEEIAFFLAL